MAKFWEKLAEKLNPAQPQIAMDEGTRSSSTQTKLRTIGNAYELVEVVNRCVNLLVDNGAMVNYDIAGSLSFTAQKPGVRQKTLQTLLNSRPNPYMDSNTFWRLLLMDFIIDGNAFIHFDGSGLYHVPAAFMEIVPDSQTYINSYLYDGAIPYKTNEIIAIKDNSIGSNYRGDSRINSSLESLYNRESMVKFQKAFFDNGASIGLIIETDQILSRSMKERTELDWARKYNPKKGSGKPLILDNGAKAKSVSNTNFREMNFDESINHHEDKVAMALGVPPILLNSGNNANIKPNMELMFYTTIIPMLRKFESALEYFFSYDIELSTHRVPALKPDQKAEAERISALVNNGIITGNEGREVLRYPAIDQEVMESIRIPQNIAGSGTGVTGQSGGKPPNEE